MNEKRHPVDIGLQERGQRRNPHDRSLCHGPGQFAAHHVLVVDRDQRLRRDLLVQHRIAARGDAVGIGHEQDHRRDAAARGFLQEADLVDHLEELVEGVKAEVDHLGDAVIDDQAVHQLHLAVGVGDIGRLGHPRQILEQGRLLQIDVERGHHAVLEQQEFAQEPRKQRLADHRSGRADDVNGREAHHGLYQANFSPNPAQSRARRDYFSPLRETGLVEPTRSVSLMRSNSLQTLASQCRT